MGDFVEKYEGSKNENGLPHGKGKNVSYDSNGKINSIEDGIWKNGFLRGRIRRKFNIRL